MHLDIHKLIFSFVDFALRCVVNFAKNCKEKPKFQSTSSEVPMSYVSQFSGLAFATCCHHCCSWSSYVGKEFFSHIQLTADDFDLIRKMSSWAVCGIRKTNPENILETGEKVEVKGVSKRSEKEDSHTVYGYSAHPKEQIGLMCKRIIDLGRLQYLKRNGFYSELIPYIDRSVSLENMMLTALKL